MNLIKHTLFVAGLLAGTVALAETIPGAPLQPVHLTADYVEGFLEEAGLQVCKIEEVKPATAWQGQKTSFWAEIAPDCSQQNAANPDVARVVQFASTPDRDAFVKTIRSNAPRGIQLRAGIWPVGNFSAVALAGPNMGKNRQALQQVYVRRLEEGKKKP